MVAQPERRGDQPEIRPLQAIREQRLFSISELARYAGVDRATIYLIEDRRSKPRRQTAEKLAEALRCEVKDVFEFQHLFEPRERQARRRRVVDRDPYQEVDTALPPRILPFEEWLLRRGLTVPDVARRAGLHEMTVRNIVYRRARPRPASAVKICEVLKIEFDEVAELVLSLRLLPVAPIAMRERGGHYSIRLDHLGCLPLKDLYQIVRMHPGDVNEVLRRLRMPYTPGRLSAREVGVLFPNYHSIMMERPQYGGVGSRVLSRDEVERRLSPDKLAALDRQTAHQRAEIALYREQEQERERLEATPVRSADGSIPRTEPADRSLPRTEDLIAELEASGRKVWREDSSEAE